jgi:protein-S-isoprenylcysteine O-methyltransferase Ste14
MRNSTSYQIRSFVLPFTVLLVIPTTILWLTRGFRWGWGFGLPLDILPVAAGVVLIGCGLYLLSITIRFFITIGNGTLAPWWPTKRLVMVGPYKYVRNPMISGVLITLLGETCISGSLGLLLWFVIALIVNHFYFIYSEEPGLEKRFGEEYIRYKQNVPRWIPKSK